MANKFSFAAGLFKPGKKNFLWLAFLPAAALLLAKHSTVKSGEENKYGTNRETESYIYTFGKKKSPGKAVIVTNQTTSGLAGTALKGFFGRKN